MTQVLGREVEPGAATRARARGPDLVVAEAPVSSRAVAGEDGGVWMVVEHRAGRTRITDLKCRPPLQVLRLHHLDPAAPDLATAILASPSGGILDGDRIRLEVVVRPGARLHIGSQSATRIYRTPGRGARFDSLISVAEGGYLELMPDPYIPYRGSRFTTTTRCEVACGGTLLMHEIVGPGRSARGEVLAFDRFEGRVELGRPDGSIFATDTVQLDPTNGLDQIGLLGDYRCIGSLFVVHEGFSPDVLVAGAESAPLPSAKAAPQWGASFLPGGAGAWLRVLAPDTGTATAVLHGAWAAARELLIGAPTPSDHRF